MPTKVRLIGSILIDRGWVVQSVGFHKRLPIGKPEITLRYLERWDVDELMVLDISRDRFERPFQFDESLRRWTKDCRTPVSAGGGILKMEHIQSVVRNGADRVVMNTALWEKPELVKEAARVFGRQAIIASVDLKTTDSGKWLLMKRSGTDQVHETLEDACRRLEDLGVGEIYLHSIDRDGSKRGFNLDAIHCVCGTLSIPVTVGGGFGGPEHIVKATRAGASGVSIGNALQFKEHSVDRIKSKTQQLDPELSIKRSVRFGYPEGEMHSSSEGIQ